MYCGSCMHDNALARALRGLDVDCVLQPVYTPIRADGASVASDQVFFGGIHIYLLQVMPWLRMVPKPMRRWLDWPPLIRFATRRAASTDAAKLGALSISMLKGVDGFQADEVTRLVDWLADEKPEAVVLSNLLIGGALPEIRKRLPNTRLIVILQGDDIFLDHLPEKDRHACIELCTRLIESVDVVVTNSQFYADKMGALFNIPQDKRVVEPLSIDVTPFGDDVDAANSKDRSTFRLGYLARIAPEKGFHQLVDAFIQLASDRTHDDLTLHAAGWLGEANKAYLQKQKDKIEAAGLTERFSFVESPELEQKVSFLKTLDLLSVPTDYEEPKGLFVLEALAAGVPVVQPDHGAFGELVNQTQGGIVVVPKDVDALCEAIDRLKRDHDHRQRLGESGRKNVLENHTIEVAAERMKRLFQTT